MLRLRTPCCRAAPRGVAIALLVIAGGIHAVAEKEGVERGRPWAFGPIAEVQPPEVAAREWVQSPIDRFVLARREKAGLVPVAPADKHTLIRRASFGLTGLPPTPDEIEAFVNDRSPEAFAKLVERLLASPAYGERWGRHWLDVARYGDCNGADESKPFPNAYRYRNYVIEVFNRDLPFDQFVRHQIAGDLLDPTADHRGLHPLTGTGFLVLGTKIVAEKDQPKMFADIVDEQIDTLGRAFMGISLGCARCHDHKFDPVSTKDYYALAGIFHSTRTMASGGQWLERPLKSAESHQEKVRHVGEVAALEAKLAALRQKAGEALPAGQSALEFEAETFARGNLVIDMDRYGKGIGIIGDVTAEADWAEWDVTTARAGKHIVQFRYAAAVARPGRILLNGAEGKANAMGQVTGGWMPANQRWFTEGVFPFIAGVNVLRYENPRVMSHLDKVRILPLNAESEAYLARRKEIEALEHALAELGKKVPKPVTVMAVEEGKVRDVKVHLRGSHLELGDEVPRRFPEEIAGARQEALPADQSGRLQLAEWLTDPQHPLTARVIVNRVWRWHFGQGLVRTPNNFGVRGEPPTHPALLDFLATQFMRDGWSIKALHRRILASGTYQLSSVHNPDAARAEPENRLLWRFNRQRLEAEAIRDAVLAVAGQLDRRTGGAPLTLGTYNLSPADLEKNRRFYETSVRRSVYLPVLRTNVYEFLTLFDFSNPDFSEGHRVSTTVPTQALLMMNSEMYALRARQAAVRLLADEKLGDDGGRLRHAYLTFFGRRPEPAEITRAVTFLRTYRETGNNVSEEDAWAALCQTFFASNEFVYLN